MNLKDHILCDLYFVTSTVVDWVDIFTRPKYKHIVVDSLVYCQQHKPKSVIRNFCKQNVRQQPLL